MARPAVTLAILLLAGGAEAQWNAAADEANRQRQMASMRATAAANDRANADRAFQSGLAGASRGASASGASSFAPSPSTIGRSGIAAPSRSAGPQSVVATKSYTVFVRETPEKVFARLTREAAAGDREAQWNVGRMAYAGFGTPRDDALARRSFTVAAERGHVGAAAMAGYLSYHGKGGIADPLGGRALLKKAADGGDRWGQGQYGLVVFGEANASGISDDLRLVAAMLEQAAASGELAAQLMLGTTVYYFGIGNVARDDAKMLKYLRMAADSGDGMALTELGRLHFGGHPAVAPDVPAGWTLIRKAAVSGWPAAQRLLGIASLQGSNGIAKNEAEGLKQLRAAVAGGSLEAKADYALILDEGLIVPRDLAGAVRLSREAAAAGGADGRVIYAKYLYHGEGVTKDLLEAARLARLAAEQGNADGELLWGTLLWEGAGTPVDRPAAVRWFRKAATKGNAQAVQNLRDAEVAIVAARLRE